jgi:D-alanyl-D-alanine carboxypeptidase
MRRRAALRSVIAVTVAALCWSAEARATQSVPQSVADQIVAAGAPGAIVNVDDAVIATSGVADPATGRPMAPELRFRAASLTKSFTATVVLQLVAEGRLRLDEPLERRLPGVLPYGDRVTIRMLLQHTSGVPDYWESGADPLLYRFLADPLLRSRTWTPPELVALVADLPPTHPPGAGVHYSSTDYVLLGMVVERVTHRSLAGEVERRVVGPLGLDDTSLPVTRTTLPPPFTRGSAAPLDANGNQIGPLRDMTEYNPSVLWGMGNLISSADDLNRFYRALIGGRLLPRALTAEMKRTVPYPEWGPVGFGLGVWSFDLPCGRRVFGHEGQVPGYNTWSYASADGGRAITLAVPELQQPWALYNDVVAPGYIRLWCG